jgi:hypothetical protein
MVATPTSEVATTELNNRLTRLLLRYEGTS